VLRIDDPLLSLILRFVLSNDELAKPDEKFIQRQIQTLKEYVAQFPEADQEKNALEWIEKYAENYRRNWEKKTVPAYVSQKQCEDCPMVIEGNAAHCAIHHEWLQLLEDYCQHEISTRSYVLNALALLQEHKNQLKLNVEKTRQRDTRC